MTFEWPTMLWLLLAVPLLVALYLLILHLRKRSAVRYASLGLVKAALGPGNGMRRHLPPVLFLLALALMITAIARPMATVTLPMQQNLVLLAMDVSGSMRAADVQPNRLEAAQAAAKAFIDELPPRTKVGIVSFAATASVVQAPTFSHDDLFAAIDRFQLQRGTAIGSGLLLSLATLFPDAGIQISRFGIDNDSQDTGQGADPNAPIARQRQADALPFKPVPPGSNNSVAIILLTDGQRTTGPDPLEVAKMVADRGVRVFTVGVGTKEGQIVGFEGWSMHVRLDEDTLKHIAAITQGEYFYAGDAPSLKKIYQELNVRIAFEKRRTEITALFSAAAALFATLAALLSLWWHHRLI